ncbi:MAG: 1-deoxy-D-xylulose-5-phosphate reductoisomerase [Eggerthellaceae bacterium]|nr:1-deoxy-D-xylulose-5-phosphate reductoisomerase [Eggerthellaceae bacterium]
MKRIVVLGCTGSIGTQTLDVVRRHPDKLQVVGLACGTRVSQMLDTAREFGVANCATSSLEASREADVPQGVTLAVGDAAVLDLVCLPEADLVVNSLVGAAGLRASYETLKAGKVLALANKESLVVGGDLLCSAALANSVPVDAAIESGGTLDPPCSTARPEGRSLRQSGLSHSPDSISLTLEQPVEPDSQPVLSCLDPTSLIRPIDSEHGAIFQCLVGERLDEVTALWVTASGGPFRGRTREQLVNVTPEEALAHPTWNMGPKITIDSSTLMNKGLEVIEAHHLFAMSYDKIRVVVQPQSAIHSMVEFSDGSVKAHLGTTDMRIPIQYALSYPDRWDAPVEPLDFTQVGSLEFAPADTETFRCLSLARAAGQTGGTLPCAMNAANERAVAAFLNKSLGYLGIADCVEAVMDAHSVEKVTSIEQLLDVDAWARDKASQYIESVR